MSVIDRKCGNCAHGSFPRTPTGRIKKNAIGKCVALMDLWRQITQRVENIPCLINPKCTPCAIAPGSKAGSCPRWQEAKEESKNV